MSIEKLTGQVMANPTAAAIYSSLDEHVPPQMIQDNYLEAKLSGNTAECLALELFARQIAMNFFHVPGVIDMLAAVEKYKAMRKPGTRAPKELQDIASKIEKHYQAGAYTFADDGRLVFKIPTGANRYTKITCKNSKPAVMLLCAKYRRGLPRGFGNGKAAR